MEEQRKKFIKSYLQKTASVSELCRQFQISRKNGYKWIERYSEYGDSGLKDLSRARLNQQNTTDPGLVKEILSIRYKYPTWGPKKVLGFLREKEPQVPWPSTKTIGKLFDKYGLTVPRKVRTRLAERTDPLSHCKGVNDIWCIDFKGWSKDHQKFDPFTLTDAHSRFLLSCLKLNVNDTEHVWAVFDRLFREYGLPLRVRSDNGPPFATKAPGRLSKLSIKLIKAGVIPEWIDPGKPQQNGRHERMHRTLKAEGIFPEELTLEEQMMKSKEFVHYYNFIRPHEALSQKCPGSIYHPSARKWNGRLEVEYPSGYKIGRVKSCGKMSFRGGEVYLGRTFSEELIGLKENEAGELLAYFGPIKLGVITDDLKLEVVRREIRKKLLPGLVRSPYGSL